MSLKLNRDLLEQFEKGINTVDPNKGSIPIEILGYGEISLVFSLSADNEDIVYKRLPIFDTEQQVIRHIQAYRIYQTDLLEKHIGLNILPYGSDYVFKENGSITLFLAQKKLEPSSFGHKLIHTISLDQITKLIRIIMVELHKVFAFNRSKKSLAVGIDAQISNWAIKDYKKNLKITDDIELFYLDTSTPMFRKYNKEAMEAELFLKSAPSFLRSLLKYLFLQEVLDRYYDWRLVTIDLLANMIKEQKPEVIPSCLRVVNQYFRSEASEFNIKIIEKKEIFSYYKEDKMIWDIFQTTRKFDRWLQTKVFRQPYEFYLPPPIER
jgi:hypothetical protein